MLPVAKTHPLLLGFVALLLNAAYLVAAPSASLWYFLNVAAHPLLGVALAYVALRGLIRHASATRPLVALGAAFLAVGLLLGLAVVVLGGDTPIRAPALRARGKLGVRRGAAGGACLAHDGPRA